MRSTSDGYWLNEVTTRGTVAARYVQKRFATTGAGDAFNRGYLADRVTGLPIEAACRPAHCVAAASVGTKGAFTVMSEPN
ncbi:PfkB family carbohydrate kinase [Rhizobium sp. PL01]|uniref:PfkB family carbohydrate kinase n=1 Tax=Rhizobium sp. PL01 TaxID=3085631 RepID=UPI00298227EC|nr:PfkB family carbohydrate kinase [Rhizobium sp. PL01]MDW5315852.1 PfkB family carbohydrate kinase [Rhizobium sp. PL01]